MGRQNYVWPFFSALKIEEVSSYESYETLVSTSKSTRCNNPEDQHRHLQRCVNLKSHIHGVTTQKTAIFLSTYFMHFISDMRKVRHVVLRVFRLRFVYQVLCMVTDI
jgi:alpha-acetolactate decarboxylase